MRNAIKIAVLAVAGLTLTACGTTDMGYSDKGSSGSRQATSAAESACMAAVNRQYGGKYDVRVIRSEYSEANSLVMVDANPVGGMTEHWRCLVSNDGEVQDLSLAQGQPTAGQGNFDNLVGMRASSLGAEMAGRGFENVGGYQAAGAAVSTWWNASSRECLSVETRQGRVAKVGAIAEGNCQ
jgi:hypothetical protein